MKAAMGAYETGLDLARTEENGNYYVILGLYIRAIWGYDISIVEKKMDTTILYWR